MYRNFKLFSLFALVALLLSGSMVERADLAGMSSSSAVLGSNVIRVASGTLTVFNDGSMITEDSGQLEIVSDRPSPGNTSPPEVSEVSVVTQVVNLEEETAQQPRPSGSQPVVVRILSGTLTVSNDGSMVTEDGGQIEIVPDTPSPLSAKKDRGTEEVRVESVVVPGSQSLDNPCYEHTAWVSFDSTNYTRVTNYCVNPQGNEVVKTIKITNTGNQDTAILDQETLGVSGMPLLEWWQSGPWIIEPGATLKFEPWTELHSGWERDEDVAEEWRPVVISHDLPDSP
ncbi:MAG: hypothetical protein GVY30_00290 [Chloroflexi bacterium]|jgi:hypothetical protein|nr:hypothetical protein [Chloroflexota bacterium]